MSVHVRIDRIVFDGFALAAGDAAPLHAAIEAELTRRLRGDAGAAGRVGNAGMSRLSLTLESPPDSGRETLGRTVARTLHSGVFR